MSAQRQRGAALITSIFLIVVIAAIATMVANIATTQQVTSGRALDVTRAYYAARARLDAEVAQLAATSGHVSCVSPVADSQLNGITTVRLSCDPVSVSEGGADYTVFTVRVAAYRGDRTAGTLVRRELRAVVTNR